jgi:pimeloyl-ACP methyl ester carboxylesterase
LSGHAGQSLHAWWVAAAAWDAKVVLYLHGNDGNVSTNMGEIAPLRELGYAVFMPDYRGYGDSEGSLPSEKTVYEDAEAAWIYLVDQRGIRPASLAASLRSGIWRSFASSMPCCRYSF